MSSKDYRQLVNQLGKKQFTFLKMQEYGFWPKNIPTPYEQQDDESDEDYAKRQKLMKDFDKMITQITQLYNTRRKIKNKLEEIRKVHAGTHDTETIRKLLAKEIMQESIKRRQDRKKQRALEKEQRSKAWEKKKQEEIVFVGKTYSSLLYRKETNKEKLKALNLPFIKDSKQLANFLELEFKELRFLTYHRDVVSIDHYTRYEIPKKRGGTRTIAAPKPLLKKSQRTILDQILCNIPVSEQAHGFIKEKSVITGASSHPLQPYLIINMDLKDFFPTVTFERVRGLFYSLGYSGEVSTLLAMLCTYCERIPIKVKEEIKHVAVSKRILPQGSPASPMITNILSRKLDKRLIGLAKKFGFHYTRYADDISFSLQQEQDVNFGRFCGLIYKIVDEEGFVINKLKTRFLRKNNQQKITGIIINNSEAGLPRTWIRKYRAAIYNANRNLNEDGEIPPEKIHEISGMTSWVKSVNPKRYAKLINSATDLLKIATSSN